MHLLRILLASVSLFLVTANAGGAPNAPRSGVEYTTLAKPVRTDSGKKVEVVEFFMYHCPYCNTFDPLLAAWVKAQGDKIVFRRVHLPYTGAADPEAALYLTLEALGLQDKLHEKVLHAVHGERKRLNQDAPIADWVVGQGVERQRFLDARNSPAVQAKLKRAGREAEEYQIESAPSIVIGGRYLTSPTQASTNMAPSQDPMAPFHATLQVMDALLAKELAAAKGGAK